MVVIIPLTNSTLDNYSELKYSLRSITLHNNITGCLLVGGKPGWYTGDHLPHQDYGIVKKEINIRDKLLSGANIINDEFMFANDDHFLLTPYAGEHNKGLLSECISKLPVNGSYTKTLQNTLNYFGDVPNADTHCPLIMNTYGVNKLNFDWPVWGMGVKTSYCQLNNIHTTFYPDCKIDYAPPKDRLYFSTTSYRGYLSEMFTKKSIFEK